MDKRLSDIARQAWLDCPLDGDHWEAAAEAVRSAVWDEAVAALAKQFNAVEEAVCLPAYRDGWADALGCLKSLKRDMCHERPETTDGSVSPQAALQTGSEREAQCDHDWVVDGHYAFCAREGCDYVRKPQGDEREAE